MESNKEKERRNKALLIVAIIILLLLNIFLFYRLTQKDNTITEKEQIEDNLRDEKEQLQELLNQTENELLSYKNKNAQLDSIILKKEQELKGKIAQIRTVLKKGNISKAELDKARAEIDSLRNLIAQQKMEIDSLSKLNQFLVDENYAKEKELEEEKVKSTKLEEENIAIQKVVAKGKRLLANNISFYALKDRFLSSKEKETNIFKKMQRLVVKFNIAPNAIADKGNQTFYLKIIDPEGVTLYNEAAGSGKLNTEKGVSNYTDKKSINFENKGEEVAFSWQKAPGMKPGTYEAVIYCQNYEMGSKKIQLE